MLSQLEKKLENVEVSYGPKHEFVPKVHSHHDMSKWYCAAFQAMGMQDGTQARSLADALRQSIWEEVQGVKPVPPIDTQDFGSDQATKLVKEMVRIMKFRVVSYERTTRQVVNHTKDMIHRAKNIATQLYKKQKQLSNHVRSKAVIIKEEKLGQLPPHVQATIVVDDPNFGQAFRVQAQANSKQVMMDQMKHKLTALYKQLHELQQERVHAVLKHDKAKVKHVDQLIRKLKTQTRAIMGARLHLASLVAKSSDDHEMPPDEPSGSDVHNAIRQALQRLEAGMTSRQMLDYDMYKHEIEQQINEHTNGMMLYLGLQTEHEVQQIRQALIKEVCISVAKLYEQGRQEVLLLNQELTTFYRDMVGNKEALEYLELVAQRYRASIAKLQVHVLALFDKR